MYLAAIKWTKHLSPQKGKGGIRVTDPPIIRLVTIAGRLGPYAALSWLAVPHPASPVVGPINHGHAPLTKNIRQTGHGKLCRTLGRDSRSFCMDGPIFLLLRYRKSRGRIQTF